MRCLCLHFVFEIIDKNIQIVFWSMLVVWVVFGISYFRFIFVNLHTPKRLCDIPWLAHMCSIDSHVTEVDIHRWVVFGTRSSVSTNLAAVMSLTHSSAMATQSPLAVVSHLALTISHIRVCSRTLVWPWWSASCSFETQRCRLPSYPNQTLFICLCPRQYFLIA